MMIRWTVLWTLLLTACITGLLLLGKAEASPTARVVAPLQVAADHWGVEDSCPYSSVNIEWKDMEPGIAGRATIDGCALGIRTIWLNSNLRIGPRWWCTIVTHEYGHLIGLEHDPDPRHVMHWQITHIVYGC